MAFYFLPEKLNVFPHPEMADDEGLLAIGGELTVERLLLAYNFGIFPWFNSDEIIMWWTPNPRMVIYPKNVKVSKSMRSYFNQNKYHLSFDQRFFQVINACKTQNRKNQQGTWITNKMIKAYCELHERGIAHSVEVWNSDSLVGGLYGVSIGKIFFGESMFSKQNNASKFGFIALVRMLEAKNYTLIDCQQETAHMKSLGATLISRNKFLNKLRENMLVPVDYGSWRNSEFPI